MGVSSAHQVVAPRETDPSIAVSAKPAGQHSAKPKMHPMAIIAFVFSLSGLAPLSLILGPLIENNLRRAVNLYNGDYSRFFTDPISLVFLVIAVLWVFVPQIMKLRGKKVLVEEG